MYDKLPACITNNTNFIYIRNQYVNINGLKIYGCPDTLSYDVKFLDWSHIPIDTDILVTHNPPLEIGDSPRRAGCPDLLKRVCEVKPKYHLYGHTHEGYGTYNKNGIQFINAALQNATLNKPIVIEI